MLQRTLGIVLRTVKYKDTSFIADVFTEVAGRVSFVVKMPRSRKSVVKPSLFQPLAIIELESDFKPNSSLYKVNEVKSAYPFASLPFDPYKSAIALFVAEFLGRALREEGENRSMFAYISHSIRWLDGCERDFANFHLVFMMRLSRFLGLLPNLADYHAGCCFDLQNGCFVPAPPFQHSHFIKGAEAEALYQLMRMDYGTMYLFKMNRHERLRCLDLIVEYYRLHLPSFPELKSLEVLKELFA